MLTLPHLLISVIVGLGVLLMLVRPRDISEIYWVGSSAFLLIVSGLVPLGLASHAISEGSDVYLFLIGMMLLSELAREHGVFDWLAAFAVGHADGSARRLFTFVYAIGTLVTIFLSNDATAVVLTPAILTVVRRARVQPLPYIFACALIANAASFVLPISNPANLVVFHKGMPPLARWLLSFGLPSLLSVVATYCVLRILFRRQLSVAMDKSDQVGETHPLNRNGKLILVGLFITVTVLIAASAFDKDLGLPTCMAALIITAVISIKSRMKPLKLLREISWSTLALVACLFIMVDAMESTGALRYTSTALHWAESLPPAIGAFITAFTVGIANNLVNNLPLGLIAGATLHASHTSALITNAVLIGVDLGPNLSVTGSLATILWLIALRKEKLDVAFWDFLKIGLVAMPVAMLASIGAAVLMNIVLNTA